MQSRCRRIRSDPFSQFMDPGKDIFAYLFLVMLFFAFMVMMVSTIQPEKESSATDSVRSNTSGQGISKNKVSVARKQNGSLVLQFQGELFTLDSTTSLQSFRQLLLHEKVLNDQQKPVANVLIDDSVAGTDVPGLTMKLNEQGITVQFIEQK